MRVAVIGAGPGGIVTARFLKMRGFEPRLIEAHDDLGGQWAYDNPRSGTWAGMRTNTARMTTRFSDLDHGDGVALFPRVSDMQDYLRAYATRFGLLEGARFGLSLERLERAGAGFQLTLRGRSSVSVEIFDRVVVATGRFNDPVIPDVPGLAAFSGVGGVGHAFGFKSAEPYRGLRVLIAGGNISALEIASELALTGAAAVGTAMRRQRYVIPKLFAGVPVENYELTRAGALWHEKASSAEVAAKTVALARHLGGDPARLGAPAPDPDPEKAGLTVCQNFLSLVSEGRIACHRWIDRIEGELVRFTDGGHARYDAILFGTGYRLNLPFLAPDIASLLELTPDAMTLADFTSHPALPGLAFVGLQRQVGPNLPPLELQARYLAELWACAIPAPGPEALLAGRAARGEALFQHLQSIRFARLIGADPDGQVPAEFSRLLEALPVTGITFRLVGPDALAGARATIFAEARQFGRPGIVDSAGEPG